MDCRYGWGRFRPACLQFLNGPKWFVFFLSAEILVYGITWGITNASVHALERRFQFTSTQIGLIVSFNEIAEVVLIAFFSFYAGYGNKIRWLGCGSLIIGIGSLLFCLPHLMIGPYDPRVSSTSGSLGHDVCIKTNSTVPDPKCFSGFEADWTHLMVFSLAMVVMGIGALPLDCLGPAYMDDNVHPQWFPIYASLIYTCITLGPGIGFLVGGAQATVYVDIKLPEGVNLTPEDPRWIGAWWIGYLMCGCILILLSVVLSGFPAQFSGSREKRYQLIQEGVLPEEDNIQGKLKDIFPATLQLLKNPIYIFNALGKTFFLIFIIGIFGFLSRFLQVRFGLSPIKAGLMIGATFTPVSAISTIIGGFIVRCFSLKKAFLSSARVVFIFGFLMFLTMPAAFIPGCKPVKLAGVTASYKNSTNGVMSTNSACNKDCGCSKAKMVPVCGADKMTYFSACMAGCQGNSSNAFTNCSCITPPASDTQTEAVNGWCPEDACVDNNNYMYFLILFDVMACLSLMSIVPDRIVAMRCVPDNQRPFALGFQFLITRALGNLPGPFLIGAIFDSVCQIWSESCDRKGSCLHHNGDELSKLTAVSGIVLGGIAFVCFFLSYWFCRQNQQKIRAVNTELTDEKGLENKGLENKGLENKGLENKGLENAQHSTEDTTM